METSICVVGLEGLQLIRISLGGRMKVRRQDGHQAIAPAAICVVLLLVAPSAGKAQDNCVLDASEVRHGTQAIDAQFTDPDTLWRPKLGLPSPTRTRHSNQAQRIPRRRGPTRKNIRCELTSG